MARIAIVGTGFVGRAWAISYARAGHEITLWDQEASAAAKALEYIAGVLPDLAANDLTDGQAPAAILDRLKPVARLAEALEGVDHVQESTPEILEVKRAVFAKLDQLAAPEAVLASSTSALLPSAFTEGLPGRQRCLVVHPLNPPYLIPAAELVPAPWTSPETMDRTAGLLRRAGHAPIVMKREIDGFLMNRLQGALLEEAFRLVADGYASTEDVDIGLRDGLALRWSFMGPFETIDLNAPGGVRDYVLRYQQIYSNIFPSTQRRVDWAGPVIETVEADRRKRLPPTDLGRRAVWRDRQLMALAAHKRRTRRELGD
ncbi:3-hydroxyacyl-CoA dehydrogenase [Labrys okinawensis]|uniref:3-hydroxyacyl-CoA dehydrogenase n=1 Tax=Labrys okinawensis TaxID=346911 RepID=UPI0039BC49CC